MKFAGCDSSFTSEYKTCNGKHIVLFIDQPKISSCMTTVTEENFQHITYVYKMHFDGKGFCEFLIFAIHHFI